MFVAVCDDDADVLGELEQFMLQYTLAGHPSRLKTFQSGEALLLEYNEGHSPFDLLILDIEMPGRNGLEVAGKLRSQGYDVPIILLTAHKEYALEGYGVRPYHYLLKPIDKVQMASLFNEIETVQRKRQQSQLRVITARDTHRIPYDNILYLESQRNNTIVHTVSHALKIHQPLQSISGLCDDRFLSSHRSYLVNVDHIASICTERQYTTLVLDNASRIPLSKRKRRAFLTALAEYDHKHGNHY